MTRKRSRKKTRAAKIEPANDLDQNLTIDCSETAMKGKGKGKDNAVIEQLCILQTPSVLQSQPNASQPLISKDSPDFTARLLQIRKAISVLFMLTDCPKTTTALHTVQTPQSDRMSPQPFVSLDTETQIVEDFTFLSSTTTDPLKVRALCLERCEDHKEGTFLLRIASNHGELETIKAGLKQIIGHLKDDLSGHNLTLTNPVAGTPREARSRLDTLLQSIVALNFNRILCRLQSKHAVWQGNFKKRKAERAPVLTQFFKVFRDTKVSHIMVDKVKSVVQTLQKLFQSFEDEQTTRIRSNSPTAISTLGDIVKCIYYLWRVPDCHAAISSPSLLRQISKIARYVAVMSSLVEQRRKHSWVGLLEVRAVRLDPVVLPLVDGGLELATRESSIPSEIARKLPQKVRRIKEHMNKTSDRIFLDLVNTKCAVHAEIQLMFHYELRSHSALPRVIFSTKAPCFLCALFFTLHGRFRVPQSHGRLYEKWTLPSTVQNLAPSSARRMDHVIASFVAVLSEQVTLAVSTSKGGRPASCESLFRRSALWARFSRAPSLIQMTENSWNGVKQQDHRPDVRDSTLRRLWCSTTMLVTRNVSVVKLGRGRLFAFQLDDCWDGRTTIRMENLCLIFSNEKDHDINLKLDTARSSVNRPLVVKIERPGTEWEQVPPETIVDVTNIEPGGEVVIVNGKLATCTNFVLRHKEDHVLVQVHSTCLTVIGKD